MNIERMFSGMNLSASGLSAQRKRMNAIASNLANAETTRTEGGGPYRRKIVQLKAKGEHLFGSVLRQAGLRLASTNEGHMTSGSFPEEEEEGSTASISATEAQDQSAPRTVYDPGNPDADENGYVKMPNVNVVTEMVSMMSASQAFEANVVAIDAAKNMAKDSLEI